MFNFLLYESFEKSDYCINYGIHAFKYAITYANLMMS